MPLGYLARRAARLHLQSPASVVPSWKSASSPQKRQHLKLPSPDTPLDEAQKAPLLLLRRRRH